MGPLVALLLAVGALVALLLYLFGPRQADPAPPGKSVDPSQAAPGGKATSDRAPGDRAASGKPAAGERPASERPASERPASERPAAGGGLPGGRAGAPLLHVVARTDPGLKRKHNEDSFLVVEERSLFVVADGMGRHAAGEVASQMAVEVIEGAFRDDREPAAGPDGVPREGRLLRDAVLEANRKVFRRASDDEACSGMGTTVVGIVFSDPPDRAVIASAGDSRCYRLRGGELRQLTTDHTLGAIGIVGNNAALLSRAVGIEENLEVDVQVDPCEPGDVYLLCSDGLSRMASDEVMRGILASSATLDRRAAELIEVANQAGGRDNVTVILVQVEARGQG